MPQFDANARSRISKTVRRDERALRNPTGPRGRYTDTRSPLRAFELLEALTQWSGDIVQAAVKTWNPALNGGNGGYSVDCGNIIYVADYNEVGHTAGVGGFGMAEMHGRENEPRWVGVIIDLCCPDDEQGVCGV